jgi:hypothetical protein
MIDLFDGNLQGTNPAKVHFLETVEGKAVDYDLTRDVGLIRIRPGRRLPASRVVPAHWQPQAHMLVLAVGCPEGHDATAWSTVIKRPRIRNFLSGNPSYEAVECDVAPKQGRSGGGLFTTDGYLAGVCNFAEPQGDHGLYATPRSIYSLLDRNALMALYEPVTPGQGERLAGRAGTPSRRGDMISVARSQSPDIPEPVTGRARPREAEVMVPPPAMLGIGDPVVANSDSAPVPASRTSRPVAWRRTHDASTPGDRERIQRIAQETDVKLDPSADHDRFGPPPEDRGSDATQREVDGSASRSNAPAPAASSKPTWKAVKAASAVLESNTARK